MARAARLFRLNGPAAASLLVNGLLIAALLNLGMGHGERRTETPPLTVLSLAMLKGAEQSDDMAETVQPPAIPAGVYQLMPSHATAGMSAQTELVIPEALSALQNSRWPDRAEEALSCEPNEILCRWPVTRVPEPGVEPLHAR